MLTSRAAVPITRRPASTIRARRAAAEAEAGVGGLPAIVLSPAATLTLEEPSLVGRDSIQLPTPFTVSRFTAAAHAHLGEASARRAG